MYCGRMRACACQSSELCLDWLSGFRFKAGFSCVGYRVSGLLAREVEGLAPCYAGAM